MTPVVLAIPSGLFRLQCLFRSLLLPSPRAFSSLTPDTEETPAMKALKDIPYPSTTPDPSIFESRSREYDKVVLPPAVAARISNAASSRSVDQSYQPTLLLEQLSRRGKFAEAELVRQELAEMNVPIPPSSVYYGAAWNVLRKRPWPPNHAEMFSNWLLLLPNKADDQNPFNFTQLKSSMLFHSPRLDLRTVAQFGIVLSSKGYIRDVAPTVVTCLTRYSDPDASSQILDDMIAANNEYHRRKLGTTHHVSTQEIKSTTKHLWSVAVRTHCTAGRPEVAFKMAKRAHEHGFWLTKYTYEYLLGKLNADGLNDLAAELRAYLYYGTLDVAKSSLVRDVSNLPLIPPISREQSMDANLAIALAILERGSVPGLPAYAGDIVPYFDIYKTDVRGGHATNMLRSRAYRISISALSNVLLAELLHHHQRGQFRHVLWVFEKFFHVVGVPAEDITRQLWKREHYPTSLRIGPGYIPPRITTTNFNLTSRLWAMPYHTALVWSALVHLCEGEQEVLALYHLLLQHSVRFQKPTIGNHQQDDYHRDHQPPSHDSSNGSPTLVPAPADKFDAAHFRPFLIAFARVGDVEHGLRILDDMQDRGIAPSAQILGISATLQARHGEPTLALRMLDAVRGLLESDKDDEEMDVEMEMEIKMESASGAEVGAKERAEKRQQRMLIVYTSVMRGFIDRRNIVQARRVAELLHSHLGYNIEGGGNGGNARTDAVLRYLYCLEVEGPDAIPEPKVDAKNYYPFLKEPDYELIKSLNAPPERVP